VPERALTVNGRRYRWMDRPLVVVCVDGCEFDYGHRAVAAGAAPFLGRMLREGAAQGCRPERNPRAPGEARGRPGGLIERRRLRVPPV